MNQIRAWVRQGRTDAWVSHQLDISIEQLERFKREHDLTEAEQPAGPAVDPLSIPVPEPGSFEISDDDDEPEDEQEDEAAEQRSGSRSSRGGRGRSRRGSRGGRGRSGGDRDEQSQDERRKEGRSSRGRETRGRAERDKSRDKSRDRDQSDDRGSRRRGRRAGRRRGKIPSYEATFEHGGEGYGFWIDPSIADNPVYGTHWAGHRAIVVRIDPDSITIRRADAGPGGSGE